MEVNPVNKNIKALATIIPLVVVPLINERKKIKEHPDMKKLGAVSNSVYTRVKDSSKETATNVYHTSKDTASNISEKVSDRLDSRSYNKEQKGYMKSQAKEESLEKKFEKEKANHREKRLSQKSNDQSSFVPKIFQSQQDKTDDEKIDGMTVSEDVTVDNSQSPEVNAEKLTHPDNQEPDYGESYMFEDIEDENQRNDIVPYKMNELQTIETSDDMTNIQELNEEKVLNTEFTRKNNEDNENDIPLRQKHKNILDPRSAARDKYISEKKAEKEELKQDNSLFNKHRRMNFEHSNKRQRKITDGTPYVKDQSIKNYESLMFNK